MDAIKCHRCKRTFALDDVDEAFNEDDGGITCPFCLSVFDPYKEAVESPASSSDDTDSVVIEKGDS